MEYVLKRYSNRRLYDPQSAENITLDRVVELVREGHRVRVIDNASGEDATTRVLGKAFLHSLRGRRADRRTLEMLRVLIAHGGESSVDILKKTMLASLGAFEVTRQKAEEIIDTLIQKGELAKSERSQAISELMDKAQDSTQKLRDRVTDEVTRAVENIKVAKKRDLDEVEAKVDQLIEVVNRLEATISGNTRESTE